LLKNTDIAKHRHPIILTNDYTDACQVKLFLSLTDVSSGHSNCLFGYVVRDTGLRGNP